MQADRTVTSADKHDATLLLAVAWADEVGGYELRRALRRGAAALLGGNHTDEYNECGRRAREAYYANKVKKDGEE